MVTALAMTSGKVNIGFPSTETGIRYRLRPWSKPKIPLVRQSSGICWKQDQREIRTGLFALSRRATFDFHYRSGRSPLWVKVKNPNAPAVKREAEEDWGRWARKLWHIGNAEEGIWAAKSSKPAN
jgi:hypothetical protein